VERRPIAAHGETVGSIVKKKFKPRMGRQKIYERFYLSPLPGFGWLPVFYPRLDAVGYSLPRLRRFRKKINLDASKMKV
jgi:hypothetical protein